MHIFLMTSEFEGMPLALLEAMSMGCVPVVSDAGGIPEVVNGSCGFVFNRQEPMNAINQLNVLINKPDLLEKLSNSSRERIVQQFSIHSMMLEIEKQYEQLV